MFFKKAKPLALFIITLIPLSFPLPQAQAQVGLGPRCLMVTAYYSPLPNQSHYYRGTYEEELRFNGNGTNGADGTPVYPGMLAAPQSYTFGTQINIPGLGVGTVHDRGGRIIEWEGCHRVDVWMGKGEEGLARALTWGARYVDGEIYAPGSVAETLNFEWMSTELPAAVKQKLKENTIQPPAPTHPAAPAEPNPGSTPVKSEPVVDEGVQVQKNLKQLGYYTGPMDGKMESTRSAILQFQLDYKVIPTAQSFGAGNYGPKTKEALALALKELSKQVDKEKQWWEDQQKQLKVGLNKGVQGTAVESLQRLLWELSYYHQSITGRYDEATEEAVYQFQQSKGIVAGRTQPGAGIYGPKTHEALQATLKKRVEVVSQYPKKVQAWVPAKREMPALKQLTLSAAPAVVKPKLNFGVKFSSSPVVPSVVQANVAPVLKLGDRGEAVLVLQRDLIAKGFLKAGLDTGYYGPLTQEAVRKAEGVKT